MEIQNPRPEVRGKQCSGQSTEAHGEVLLASGLCAHLQGQVHCRCSKSFPADPAAAQGDA